MDLSKIPAAPPPEGVTPNFENPARLDYEVYSINIAMCATATVVLLLRLYTRGVLQRTIAIDDWLCIAAQVCAWIFAILGILNIKNGYGVHIWDLHLDKLTPFKKNDLAGEDIFAVGIWLVKTSILLFYLRLNPEKRFRQMTFGIMIFVGVYSLISLLVFTLGCIPTAALWDVTKMEGAKCVDQLAFVYANAAFNLLSDILTLILPIKLCWSLQASVKQRILLLIVLAMGSFACVIAIVRIVTMMPFIHSMDFTRYKVTLAKWAMVEINVGIICACLPVLRPLILQAFPKTFSSKNMSGGGQQGPSNDNSYNMKNSRRKVIQSWDHLTTLNNTTAQDTEGDVESVKAMVKNDEDEPKPNILITTNYSVIRNGRHDK